MDQQFFRKSKEAEISYAAQEDTSGQFRVIRKHRPSGRLKVIRKDLERLDACRLRNRLIEASS
jgi:hypothetical protein